MPMEMGAKKPQQPERNQKPLYATIIGLVISLYGVNMRDEYTGNVVFWLGGACALVGLIYWVFQPRHGL